MSRLDPHSYHNLHQPQATHVSWKAKVDFQRHMLHCEAFLRFQRPAKNASAFDLDTRDLSIDEVVHLQTRHALPFTLHPPETFLGARLSVEVPQGCEGVIIRYRTSPHASALQWLSPAQTQDKTAPFLYSQCQAIHARSVLPIQDTPRVRIRYQAALTVPQGFRALMAASFEKREENGAWATEFFRMDEPIPPYLFALAVGNLVSQDVSSRTRIWAEPSVLPKAAFEFSDVEKMMKAAEQLFGPYDWQRFDILTMPPSFPYGGMENPRLTFVTPSLLAKDKSLVNVLVHELAHSWTGNVVTNANAEHFWLNEGFTVYAERRILEVLEGKDVCALHTALGRKSLNEALHRFSKQPELTYLRTQLAHLHPDDAFSQVPYEKGFLFLQTLERNVGRKVFDAFLQTYLKDFRFQSITTEDFVDYVNQKLPQALPQVNAKAWLYEAGVPADAVEATSHRLEAISALEGKLPSPSEASAWSSTEWQLYLEALPRPVSHETCQQLEDTFGLTQSENHEVLCSWLTLAVTAGFQPAVERALTFLGQVGRMKYLRPLYQSLLEKPDLRSRAVACFQKHRANYHPIAVHMVDKWVNGGPST